MERFIVEIEVDEKILREYQSMELIDAVKAELNWVHDSGIYVVKIEKKLK